MYVQTIKSIAHAVANAISVNKGQNDYKYFRFTLVPLPSGGHVMYECDITTSHAAWLWP